LIPPETLDPFNSIKINSFIIWWLLLLLLFFIFLSFFTLPVDCVVCVVDKFVETFPFVGVVVVWFCVDCDCDCGDRKEGVGLTWTVTFGAFGVAKTL